MYLIWKMRNKRQIRDGDAPGYEQQERKIRNRWTYALNK